MWVVRRPASTCDADGISWLCTDSRNPILGWAQHFSGKVEAWLVLLISLVVRRFEGFVTALAALVPPLNVDFVGPEALGTRALGEGRAEARLEGDEPGMRDHDAVVDTEALVGGVDGAAALGGHVAHHGLQTLVTADAADDEDLRAADVRHGALRDLDEHRVHGLLEAVAELGGGDPDLAGGLVDGGLAARLPRVLLPHLRGQEIGRGQDAAEAAVHALHGVGQVEEGAARGLLR